MVNGELMVPKTVQGKLPIVRILGSSRPFFQGALFYFYKKTGKGCFWENMRLPLRPLNGRHTNLPGK